MKKDELEFTDLYTFLIKNYHFIKCDKCNNNPIICKPIICNHIYDFNKNNYWCNSFNDYICSDNDCKATPNGIHSALCFVRCGGNYSFIRK